MFGIFDRIFQWGPCILLAIRTYYYGDFSYIDQLTWFNWEMQKTLFGSFNICACNKCGYVVRTTWVRASFVQCCILFFDSTFHGCQCGMIIIIHFLGKKFSFDLIDFQWICSVHCSCIINNLMMVLSSNSEGKISFSFPEHNKLKSEIVAQRNSIWIIFKRKNSNHIQYTSTQSVLGMNSLPLWLWFFE